MHEARDAERAIWDDITRSNPLRVGMQSFYDRVLQMALGKEPRSQMLIAPHGCGKGTVIERAIAAADKAVFLIDKVTSNSLPYLLQDCGKKGIIVVADDRDELLRDLVCLEHFSKATGSVDDGFSGIGSAITLRRADNFSYKGTRMAIATNVDPRDPAVTNKSVSESWLKLGRRIQITKIVATEEERYQYTCYQIVCEHVLRRTSYTTQEINEVLDFFARNRHRLSDPSVGGVKALLTARRLYPDWRNQNVEKDRYLCPELGPIPKIIPADKSKKVKVNAAPIRLKPRIANFNITPKLGCQALAEPNKRNKVGTRTVARVRKFRVKSSAKTKEAAPKIVVERSGNIVHVDFGKHLD